MRAVVFRYTAVDTLQHNTGMACDLPRISEAADMAALGLTCVMLFMMIVMNTCLTYWRLGADTH